MSSKYQVSADAAESTVKVWKTVPLHVALESLNKILTPSNTLMAKNRNIYTIQGVLGHHSRNF